MPTYLNECADCYEQFSAWQSIHDDSKPSCSCGGQTVRVISRVNTHGIGVRGQRTREVDSTEARWDKDLPAYKRLRHNGYQPPSVDGCATLETEATSGFEIETGLKYGHMDSTLVEESMQMARESGWDPKKKVEV
jgi:putative FmdB family regulatory protein